MCTQLRPAVALTLSLSLSLSLVLSLSLSLSLSLFLPPSPALAQGHPAMGSPIAKPITLSEAQVTGFLAAVEELKTSSEKSGWKDADPSKPMAMANALQISKETTAILHKHGFKNHTDFQQVAYNAAMAYAVLQEGGKEAMKKKLDQSQVEQEKAMEQMRGRLSPEQAEMLSAQVQNAMRAAATMQDVPDANIDLMKKYSDRWAKLASK